MTAQQRQALDFIATYQSRTGGASPSLEEIGAHIGRSKVRAHGVVAKLIQTGRLQRAGHRDLILLDESCLAAFSDDAVAAEFARRFPSALAA